MPNEVSVIEFADGSRINGEFGINGSTVWVWPSEPIENGGFCDLAGMFSTANKTRRMVYYAPGAKDPTAECEGYTWLTDLIVDPDTLLPKIRLRKG